MQNAIIEKKRDSNFELLRIIAMFLIVIHHLQQHGVWFPPNVETAPNFALSRIFYMWSGMIGNWIFVLISGYFVCTSKFSWKKVFALWLQIFSISAVIGLIAYFSKIKVIGFYNPDYGKVGFFEAARPASKKDLIHSFLPCYYGNNWFAVAYLVFYLFVPFLNQFRENLNQKMHLQLIVLMFVLGCVVKQLPFEQFFQQDNLYMFILGYFIASYIRFYNPKILSRTKINLIIFFCLFSFFAFWNFVVYTYLYHIAFVRNHIKEVLSFFGGGMAKVLSLTCALSLFCVFRQMKIPYNRFINTVASATFGVYLLHENLLINKTVWHGIFKLDDWISSPYLLPYMFFCAIVVFIVCTIIELLRKKLFDRLF